LTVGAPPKSIKLGTSNKNTFITSNANLLAMGDFVQAYRLKCLLAPKSTLPKIQKLSTKRIGY